MYSVKKGNVIKRLKTIEDVKDYVRAGWEQLGVAKEEPKKEEPKKEMTKKETPKKETKKKYVDFKL